MRRNAEVAKARRERMVALQRIGVEAHRKKSNELWDTGRKRIMSSERGVLRQVLRAYDRDPQNFRAWLLLMIGREEQAAE